MADDPYFSFKPVVQAITGFFIAVSLVSVPVIIHGESRVKSIQDTLSIFSAGEPKTDTFKRG